MTETQNRIARGVPTGGQFSTMPREESDVSLAPLTARGVREHAEEMARAAETERLRAFRLEMCELLGEEAPSGVAAETLHWYEEPHGDGTFDVNITHVYDDHGDTVGDLGNVGATPTGWFDDDAPAGYRTAFDLWRDDPEDPNSLVDLDKMRRWHRDQVAIANGVPEDLLDPASDHDCHGLGWGEHRPTEALTDLDAIRVGEVLAVNDNWTVDGIPERHLFTVTAIHYGPGYSPSQGVGIDRAGARFHGCSVEPDDIDSAVDPGASRHTIPSRDMGGGRFFLTGKVSALPVERLVRHERRVEAEPIVWSGR